MDDSNSKRPRWEDGPKQVSISIQVPAHKLGLVIGRGGETIKEIKRRTLTDIILPPRNHQHQNGLATIMLSKGNVEEARLLIKRVVSDKPLRAPFHGVELKGVPKLYVDILNFVDSHFFRDHDDWSIGPVIERAKQFVEAARACGTSLVVFIDTVRTDEALDKWHDRMTRAVLQGKRGVPQNISGIIAEVCLRAGVQEVRLSSTVNNDDTMAAYAAFDSVPILSGDKDFLRYVHPDDGRPANLVLFSDFAVENGRLLLSERPIGAKNGISESEKRVLIVPPPSFSKHGVDDDAWVVNLCKIRSFRGGAPTPLLKSLGFNPYITIRPLRVSLYRELLKDSEELPIREEFPEYDVQTHQVVFPVTDVDISDKAIDAQTHELMIQLLMTPKDAYLKFFPRESGDPRPPPQIDAGDWYRHCHGCKVIIIELCCYLPINKARGMRFLDVLMEAESW